MSFTKEETFKFNFYESTRSHVPIKIEKIDGEILRGLNPRELRGFYQSATFDWAKPILIQNAIQHIPSIQEITDYLPDEVLSSTFSYKHCGPENGGLFADHQRGVFKTTLRDYIENPQSSDTYMLLGFVRALNEKNARNSVLAAKELTNAVMTGTSYFDALLQNGDQIIWQSFLGHIETDYGDPAVYTGSDWHACLHRNAFLQVHGTKRWDLMHRSVDSFFPKDVTFHGFCTTLDTEKADVTHLATSVVLNPGDLLFIPIGMWHKIYNGKGFNLGLPLKLEGSKIGLNNTLKRAISLPELKSEIIVTILENPVSDLSKIAADINMEGESEVNILIHMIENGALHDRLLNILMSSLYKEFSGY